MVVSISIRNEIIHYFTHSNKLTMSISCDFIFSCTKGKTTAAISFEVLYASILASERKGEGFKEMLQKLKD